MLSRSAQAAAPKQSDRWDRYDIVHISQSETLLSCAELLAEIQASPVAQQLQESVCAATGEDIHLMMCTNRMY
jgi:hypothetical protein